MRCRIHVQSNCGCYSTIIFNNGQRVCALSSAEQHFELLSQVFVGAGEEHRTSHAIKRQAKEEHICTQPRSKDGMEIVEGDDEQRREVNPNQSHRQPADEQVRLCSLRAALLLHGQGVFAEVDDQPQ